MAAFAQAPKASPVPSGYAEIVFAQGEDILVLRGGSPLKDGAQIGSRLVRGDQVQTGSGSSVELVLMPRRARLRLSENSTVEIGAIKDDGATDLKLVYGRIRSKVEKLASGSSYTVDTRTYTASVRGTDFGCDLIASSNGADESEGLGEAKVYCFEGSVEVAPPPVQEPQSPTGNAAANAPPTSAAKPTAFEPVIINAGGMAIVEAPIEGQRAKAVQKAIDIDTSAFWKARDFTQAEPEGGAALPPAPAKSADGSLQQPAPSGGKEPSAQPAAPASSAAPEIDLTPIRRAVAAKKGLELGAMAFMLFGDAFLGYSLYADSINDSGGARTYLYCGMISVGMSLPMLLTSIAVDPMRGIKK